MRESVIQKKCVAYARDFKFKAKKVGTDAWPDYLFINLRGVHLWVEFKAPGKTLSPRQQLMVNELRGRHVKVCVIDRFEVFKSMIELYRI